MAGRIFLSQVSKQKDTFLDKVKDYKDGAYKKEYNA